MALLGEREREREREEKALPVVVFLLSFSRVIVVVCPIPREGGLFCEGNDEEGIPQKQPQRDVCNNNAIFQIIGAKKDFETFSSRRCNVHQTYGGSIDIIYGDFLTTFFARAQIEEVLGVVCKFSFSLSPRMPRVPFPAGGPAKGASQFPVYIAEGDDNIRLCLSNISKDQEREGISRSPAI